MLKAPGCLNKVRRFGSQGGCLQEIWGCLNKGKIIAFSPKKWGCLILGCLIFIPGGALFFEIVPKARKNSKNREKNRKFCEKNENFGKKCKKYIKNPRKNTKNWKMKGGCLIFGGVPSDFQSPRAWGAPYSGEGVPYFQVWIWVPKMVPSRGSAVF